MLRGRRCERQGVGSTRTSWEPRGCHLELSPWRKEAEASVHGLQALTRFGPCPGVLTLAHRWPVSAHRVDPHSCGGTEQGRGKAVTPEGIRNHTKPSKLHLKMETGHEDVTRRPRASATLRVPGPSTAPGTAPSPHRWWQWWWLSGLYFFTNINSFQQRW